MPEQQLSHDRYLARRRPWRYVGPAEIEVLEVGDGSVVLRDWQTPVFHLADGSTSIGEVLAALTARPSSDGRAPEEVEAIVLTVIEDLVGMGAIEIREVPDNVDPAHDLSVDGRP